MNEQREPSPTRESRHPRQGGATVHTGGPTVGEASETETAPGGAACDEKEPTVREVGHNEAPTVRDGSGTDVPLADATELGPADLSAQTGTDGGDSSSSLDMLVFKIIRDADARGETADVSEGPTKGRVAPRGASTDPDETADLIADDQTTAPTEDTGGDRTTSGKVRGEQIGPEVPGYVILEVIGRGGMGVVYKARHHRLDRLVALKMVLSGAHASPEQLARFTIESQAVAQLLHPGIVQIYEVGEHDGLPYFSLEFVAGGSLANKIGDKPQPAREAAAMVHDLAVAMREAHRHHIIHRDLKPANVLLTPDGHPKITDFGLAKRLDADSQQTQTGATMGTPSYMAPEQAMGHTHQIGPLSDLYALGVILYEMLVGRPPFQGASPLETIELARSQEPVPPIRLQPKIPVDLETICLKCLQKDPLKRYADAAALAEDLQRFLEGRPILARPVGAVERLARWCRRNPKIAALAATVALLLATVTAVSSYAAISLDRYNAEFAARKAAEKNEQAAINARNLEAVARQKESEARAKVEKALREGAGLEEKLGDLYVALGEDRAGREHYDRAMAIREAIVREHPGNYPAERDRLLSYNKLGTFYLLQLKNPAGARVYYEKALAGFESQLGAEPESLLAKEDLAITHYYVATAALRAGDRKPAALHYKACLDIREKLAGDPKAKLSIIDLMIARARCGQHQLASKTAEEIISSPPLDARVCFQAACGFSLCAGAVAEDPASPEAKALARSYSESALKALRLALGAGWKNLVDVQTDPDLDAVRDAPGFEAVVAEYRKAAGK
jgi:tetratricopeptide (TPR) repeat protein/tRNA A-37 threonylcarbamoyl transferase component Bud32